MTSSLIKRKTIATIGVIALLAQTGCQAHLDDPRNSVAETNHSTSAQVRGTYLSIASPDGTFLVDGSEGKVWKYIIKDEAFIQIQLASELKSYNPKTGNIDPASDPATILNAAFEGFSSGDGTFVVEKTTGRAWRYQANSEKFLEVPLTTGVVDMTGDGNGKIQEAPEKNASGQPCDKKSDPLCIR